MTNKLCSFDDEMIAELAMIDDPASAQTVDREDTILDLKSKLDTAVQGFGNLLQMEPAPEWNQVFEKIANAVAPPDFSMSEDELGGYLVGDLIGRGGMGEVYQVTHRQLDRVCAMKVVRRRLVGSADIGERFQREGKANGRLNHKNIVRTTDAGEDKGYHYLVMDFVNGENLEDHVKSNGALTAEHALSYVRQAAEGLQFAHEQGVVHRDVKPANLLLNENGVIQIVDFGLAKHQTDEGLTRSGAFLGTADYTAPEPASNADHRADIYSLGCTLYYLLTGDAVYRCENFLEKREKHGSEPAPALVAEGSPVNHVFQKMVAKEPQDRFQSMTEVIEAIDGLTSEKPTAATKPVTKSTTPKKPNGWLIGLAMLGVTLALIIAGVVVVQLQSKHGTITVKAESGVFQTSIKGKTIQLKHKKTGETTTIELNKISQTRKLGIGDYDLIVQPESGLHSENKTIEVRSGKSPVLEISWIAPKRKPKTGNHEADRRVAQWVVQEGGLADLKLVKSGKELSIGKGDSVPEENFVIVQLNLSQEHRNGALLSVAEIRDLKSLSRVESILGGYLPGENAKEILAMLASHQSLKRIIWWQLPATDESIEAIVTANPNLQTLNVAGDYCTDASLKSISSLKQLESLHIGGPNYTENGLRSIARIQGLNELNLYRSSFADEAIALLTDLSKLRTLVLSRNPLTDASIDSLAQLKGLEELRIEHTAITPKGYKRLQTELPECNISWKPAENEEPITE